MSGSGLSVACRRRETNRGEMVKLEERWSSVTVTMAQHKQKKGKGNGE